MPPNLAIKCLGNTPGECSYTSFSQIGCRLPMFLHLPRRNPDHKLTVKQLVQFLRPEFSL
ncbi:unnamed protein product [Pocillopora meandrina]|uniref:HECT domain-containing protein n=1 Tax=Pocillopora meandrina TaxID=46732 RepID=A0AAU9X2V1_9CNID|nr:unnamed protein product [Pocillopora meandrina]